MEEGLKRVRELFEPFEISINGHDGEREPVTSKQNYENVSNSLILSFFESRAVDSLDQSLYRTCVKSSNAKLR